MKNPNFKTLTRLEIKSEPTEADALSTRYLIDSRTLKGAFTGARRPRTGSINQKIC